MKVKILSLVLVICLLPIMSLLSACNSGEGYNIANLNKDFFSIAVEEDDNISNIDNKLMFTFSRHKHEDKEILTECINDKNLPYHYLNDYNKVFINLMDFAYGHVGIIASTEQEISKEIRNRLKAELDELHYAIKSVNTSIDLVAEGLKLCTDKTSVLCMERYKTLLVEYEYLYQKAIKFTNSVSNVYYKNVLSDSNPDISKLTINDFNSNVVVNRLRGRISYQITNLTQVFVEKNICGGGLANKIAKKNPEASLNLSDYLSLIDKITLPKDLTEEQMNEIANSEAKKQTFYNLSVKAYNLQEILNNDSSKFASASNKISYMEVVNTELKTAEQEVCVEIIDGYDFILQQYNNTLSELIATVRPE